MLMAATRTAAEVRKLAEETRARRRLAKDRPEPGQGAEPPRPSRMSAAIERYHREDRPRRIAICRTCQWFTDGGCELLRTERRRCNNRYHRIVNYGHGHPDPRCPWDRPELIPV